MATAFVLIGSIGGFLAALVSYLVLDTPAVAALAIWLMSGPLSAALVMLAGQTSQHTGQHTGRHSGNQVRAQVRTS